MLSGLLRQAPKGLQAHAQEPGLRQWLANVECSPWPLERLGRTVRLAAGNKHVMDYRWGMQYHYLDPAIRDETDVHPRAGLATRAACLPGRLLLRLLCAHQALLPLEGEPRWDEFTNHLQVLHHLLPTAAGRGKPRDLGSKKGGDPGGARGCAAMWPWAPLFAGDRLKKFYDYVKGFFDAPVSLDPVALSYAEPVALSVADHVRINPYLRPCLPLTGGCWARRSRHPAESCEYCCNPMIPGGRGDPQCFDHIWTFERCCQPFPPDVGQGAKESKGAMPVPDPNVPTAASSSLTNSSILDTTFGATSAASLQRAAAKVQGALAGTAPKETSRASASDLLEAAAAVLARTVRPATPT